MSYNSSCHHHLHHPCSNKIQNAGIPVLAYLCCLGKWQLNKCSCLLCCSNNVTSLKELVGAHGVVG